VIAGWGNYVIVNPSHWGNYLIADIWAVVVVRSAPKARRAPASRGIHHAAEAPYQYQLVTAPRLE
jgi:hypothetical protein